MAERPLAKPGPDASTAEKLAYSLRADVNHGFGTNAEFARFQEAYAQWQQADPQTRGGLRALIAKIKGASHAAR